MRDLHPVMESAHNNRFLWPDTCKGFRPPRKPTSAEPGTEAKVEALSDRYANRRGFWHDGDAKMDPDPQGLEPYTLPAEPEEDLDDIFPPIERWGVPGGRLSPALAEVLERLRREGLPYPHCGAYRTPPRAELP